MIKYHVTLTEEERSYLEEIVAKGNMQGYRIRHANILLALDETEKNREWTDKKISVAYHVTERSIGHLRKRFVEEGFDAALERRKRKNPPHKKIDGEIEARIIALTCSKVPEGYSEWTLRLLKDKVVEFGILDSVSHTAIANCLKKTNLSHGYKNSGALENSRRNM